MPMPAAEKQREYRERKRRRGLTEVRVWIPNTDEDSEKLRRYAERLCSKAKLR